MLLVLERLNLGRIGSTSSGYVRLLFSANVVACVRHIALARSNSHMIGESLGTLAVPAEDPTPGDLTAARTERFDIGRYKPDIEAVVRFVENLVTQDLVPQFHRLRCLDMPVGFPLPSLCLRRRTRRTESEQGRDRDRQQSYLMVKFHGSSFLNCLLKEQVLSILVDHKNRP
jgi:hypothetical protein